MATLNDTGSKLRTNEKKLRVNRSLGIKNNESQKLDAVETQLNDDLRRDACAHKECLMKHRRRSQLSPNIGNPIRSRKKKLKINQSSGSVIAATHDPRTTFRKCIFINHPLMYLAGNCGYRINAIAPPGRGARICRYSYFTIYAS